MSLSLHHEKFTNYPNTAIDNLTQSASVPYEIPLIYLGKGKYLMQQVYCYGIRTGPST